jgi:uncharacterized protein (TIGR02284 family)
MSTETNDKAISVLNELIETLKDGSKGFATAAEDAKDISLKALFAKYASQRNSFAADLEGLVRSQGAKPADSGHISAAVHRGWLNLKAAVSGNDDKAILNECERGEDYAKKAYADALKEDIPGEIRAVVERQGTEVKAAHDKVRDLRDKANAYDKANVTKPGADITMPIGEPTYHE